jgi:uncharacterized paraquat-inducible protein A
MPSPPTAADPESHAAARPRRFTPGLPSHCPECGLTLHAVTVQHEQALVFASCCPRCDGPLTTGTANDSAASLRPEPSISVG